LDIAPQNHLIARLPQPDRTRLLGQCQAVELALSDVLCERGDTARQVWFPVGAFISQVAQADPHPGLEVGMVGREGMLGAHLGLGVPLWPWRAVVQGAGSAWRLRASALKLELARSAALRRLVGRYLYARMVQMTTAAVCLRFHQIEPRLARWLLMSQDRAHADQFHTTHEFLAYMLGVRRVGVTVAASALQRAGLVRYHRGELCVLDRSGLEAVACPCYQADLKAYADQLS